jgi:hypothetical protein
MKRNGNSSFLNYRKFRFPARFFRAVFFIPLCPLVFSVFAQTAETRMAEILVVQAPVTKVPSKAAPHVGFATKGQKFLLLLETTEWVRVRFHSIEGWIPRSMVIVGSPAVAPSAPLVALKSDTATIAAKPAADSMAAKGTAAQSNVASADKNSAGAKPGPVEQVRPQRQPSLFQRLFRAEPEVPAAEQETVQVRRVPRVITLPDGNRIIQNVEVPETTYVRVTKLFAPVYQTLDPQAPLLINAKKGQTFRLVSGGASWYLVAYGAKSGYLERRFAEVVGQEKPLFTDEVIRLLVFGGAGAVLVIIVVIVIVVATSRRRKFNLPALAKKVLIVSAKEKQVSNALTNQNSTLTKCFSEIGLAVTRVSDFTKVPPSREDTAPDILLVDWFLETDASKSVETMLSAVSSADKTLIIFFNFPNPGGEKPATRFAHVRYLGTIFTDRDLFDVVTPFIAAGDKAKAAATGAQSSALEGDITEGSLVGFFQFIEMGRKTGCLLVRDKTPHGMVFFEGGRITYAAARELEGMAAIADILAMKSGKFRFLADKLPESKNCSFSTMEVLMEWAKTQDEVHGDRLRKT